MEQGEKVWWLYEEKRGWGGTRRVEATFIRSTAKRVILDVEYKDGHTERKTVKPERVQPQGDKGRIIDLEARVKELEADRDNQKRIGDSYGETLDEIQEVVGRFQDNTLASVKELVQDYKKLKAIYAEMHHDLTDLYNLEGAESGSDEDDTRQQILNKWK